jgi:uncharacterized protein (DUF1499 family)
MRRNFDAMGAARAITMATAVAALAMLLFSGPGTRLGLWPWRTGLTLLSWAAYTGMAAAVAAAILSLLVAVPRWRARPGVPLLALAIALVACVPPMLLRSQAGGVPPIHDITTDMVDPPAFVALQDARARSPSGAAYGGAALAAQQAKGYPDIKPLVTKAAPHEATQRAIDAARALGWEVVASDSATGRIEATATTRWFGFQDDVVVRVRPEGSGSRIDVRSASRVGRSDLGTNAKRIREFLGKLA